ncbi:DUF2550 domain-containing protein [Skermania piniformis]
MGIGMILVTVLVLLVTALALVACYRLWVLRRGGTAAILRVLPASGGQGWRHGIIRYDDDSLVFYKLSSLKLGPDSQIGRQGIEVEERRGPRGDEYDIMTDEIVVLGVVDAPRSYEIAFDRGALAAFQSWIESRPSGRQQRGQFD